MQFTWQSHESAVCERIHSGEVLRIEVLYLKECYGVFGMAYRCSPPVSVFDVFLFSAGGGSPSSVQQIKQQAVCHRGQQGESEEHSAP